MYFQQHQSSDPFLLQLQNHYVKRLIYCIEEMENFGLQYNSSRTQRANVVWCAAMSIAWTDFRDVNTQHPIRLQTIDQQTQIMIDNFNDPAVTYDDIDQKSYYVRTGYGKEAQALINKQVRNKFKNYSFQDLDYKLRPNDIISFAYIYKKLDFECKFQRRNAGFKFNGVQTKSFYAVGQPQKKQVTVSEYKNRDRFCIRIGDRLNDHSIYLIKNHKIMTIDKAIQVSIQAQKKGGQTLIRKDQFQMPVIDISCLRNYKELTGLPFQNEELKGYFLQVMCEAVKLKIDESGALLQNRAMMVCTKGCAKKVTVARQFILDSTFWLVMKQSKKHPYLCMQISNPVQLQM